MVDASAPYLHIPQRGSQQGAGTAERAISVMMHIVVLHSFATPLHTTMVYTVQHSVQQSASLLLYTAILYTTIPSPASDIKASRCWLHDMSRDVALEKDHLKPLSVVHLGSGHRQSL